MLKLSEKTIRYGRTDGRTDSNYRKASLLKIKITCQKSEAVKNYGCNLQGQEMRELDKEEEKMKISVVSSDVIHDFPLWLDPVLIQRILFAFKAILKQL